MDNPQEELYQCVGVCMADPDSGYCLGCGRPPMSTPGIVAEAVPSSDDRVASTATRNGDDPDTPA